MDSVIEGFAFIDFCTQCHKLQEHRVSSQDNEFYGMCSSCGQKRLMTDLNEVYYPQNDLWVTRFKIGNMPSVVAGKAIDAVKRAK
jgi:hypothetical protein